MARGTILVGFRDAAVHLYGPAGLDQLGKLLPPHVREQTLNDPVLNVKWYPEEYILAWYDALWRGPCEQRREAFVGVLDRMMDFGFGRVRA